MVYVRAVSELEFAFFLAYQQGNITNYELVKISESGFFFLSYGRKCAPSTNINKHLLGALLMERERTAGNLRDFRSVVIKSSVREQSILPPILVYTFLEVSFVGFSRLGEPVWSFLAQL